MEQMLQEFICALRASGVRISVAETIEAFKAVSLVGYGRRGTLKDALSATLPKSLQEKEIFEECFERYFALDRFSGDEGEPSPSAPEPDGTESPLSRMLLEGDRDGLAVAMRRAAREVDLSGIRRLDHANLSLLLTAQRQAQEEDRAVWLAGVPFEVWQALYAMGLGDFFKPFPISREVAV